MGPFPAHRCENENRMTGGAVIDIGTESSDSKAMQE
jgi:hypothetical protein